MVAGKVFESNLQLADINALVIEPSTHCNAKCPHCARFDADGNVHKDLLLGHLDLSEIKQNIELDNLVNLKFVKLEGDKGDPMMNPNIDSFIDFFSQAPSNPLLQIVTNGSIRSNLWWESLAKKIGNRVTVTFSIDGLQDTNHLYRIGLDYEKIISNAKAFIDAGGNAVWKFILFGHNEHQLDDVIDLSRQLGFTSLEYVTCREGEFQGLSEWPVKIHNKLSHVIRPPRAPKSGKVIHDMKRHNQYVFKVDRPERICPWQSAGILYITHLGQLLPCCMMHFDTELDYPGRKRLLHMTGGFDNQDLHIHSLSSILKNKLFNYELFDSLKNGQWHFNCVRSCKSQILENLNHV